MEINHISVFSLDYCPGRVLPGMISFIVTNWDSLTRTQNSAIVSPSKPTQESFLFYRLIEEKGSHVGLIYLVQA